MVTHSYQFPGDYNVVLNVTKGSAVAVSRTKVKVINPEISIINSSLGDHPWVDIKNNALYEVDLGFWQIVSGDSVQMIARDTIIDPGQTLRIPITIQDTSDGIGLMYLDDRKSTIAIQNISNQTKVVDIAVHEPTREEIEAAKAKVALMFAQESNTANIPQQVTEIDSKNNAEATTSVIDKAMDTSDTSSLLASPKKIFKFIKNFFTR